MLGNVKYNLGKEYNFYAPTSPGQRSKGGTSDSSGGQPGWEKK